MACQGGGIIYGAGAGAEANFAYLSDAGKRAEELSKQLSNSKSLAVDTEHPIGKVEDQIKALIKKIFLSDKELSKIALKLAAVDRRLRAVSQVKTEEKKLFFLQVRMQSAVNCRKEAYLAAKNTFNVESDKLNETLNIHMQNLNALWIRRQTLLAAFASSGA